jgi:TRAP-type C4-dicarboxylate transport system permease small subunit
METSRSGLLDRLERLFVGLGAASLGLLAVAIAGQLLFRYAFSITPIWSEELSRFLLIIGVLIGAAVSVRGNRHIRVEFLVELLPRGAQRAWYLLLDLVTLALFVIIVVTGIEAVGYNHMVRSAGLQLPLSYIMAFIPLCFALAAIFMVAEIVQRIRRK